MLVVILIISAGGLAFVVLYNLNNINVGEALKNAPVLKDLNKDELPKYIGYNPKTGEMGGAPKEDGKTNEDAKKEEQKEPDKKDESDAAKGSEDEAKAALEDTNGDLAEAILKLNQ